MDGAAEPLPEWVGILRLAEQWSCPPWEISDEERPKAFWRDAAELLNSVDAEIRRRQRADA